MGQARVGGQAGSGFHWAKAVQYETAPVSTSKIPNGDSISPIAGVGVFLMGRTSLFPEGTPIAAIDPSGCSGRHFGTDAPPGHRQFRVGLLTINQSYLPHPTRYMF